MPIDQFLAGGGPSPISVWHSFGQRHPSFGLSLQLNGSHAVWGGLGPAVTYDLVAGNLAVLRSTGGDFTLATDACLGGQLARDLGPHGPDPLPGQGVWYLLRAVRGSIAGTYDTLQPSQVGQRDAEIAASASACP